jgi:two-component system NtrC family sensor kinase
MSRANQQEEINRIKPPDIELSNRRILIIDDTHSIHQDFEKVLIVENHNSLEDMEAMLFGQGLPASSHNNIDFELDSAFQGEQALEKVKLSIQQQLPYALAFVDVRMPPGWDGIQTIEYLWQVDPDLQVVICTAYSDHSWQETFSRLGNSDNLLILKKPFESVEVLQMANALVHKWNSTAQAKMKLADMEEQITQRTLELSTKNQQLESKIAELNQTRSQLIQSEKLASIGQLAAGIAHEINNPLGFIHSNLDVLSNYIVGIRKVMQAEDQLTDLIKHANIDNDNINTHVNELDSLRSKLDMAYIFNDMPDLISEALSGTARVKEIVADLKDYTHMNQQSMGLEDINHLIEQAISISSNETKHHFKIVKNFSPLPKINCWRSKLIQVVLNLLLNANQAISQDGTVEIATKYEKNQIKIRVKDNGCGIKTQDLDKIFDPFFTTKEIGTGTGLGLHICHSIITSHGGTLSATSQPGQGSCFTISLPICR